MNKRTITHPVSGDLEVDMDNLPAPAATMTRRGWDFSPKKEPLQPLRESNEEESSTTQIVPEPRLGGVANGSLDSE